MATRRDSTQPSVRWHTALELGVLIREARLDRKWTQAELAQRAGVGRQWLVSIERGRHSRAEIGLVLRVLSVLGVELFARISQATSDDGTDVSRQRPGQRELPTLNLDDLFGSLAASDD